MSAFDELQGSYEAIVDGLSAVPESGRYDYLLRLVLLAADRLGSAAEFGDLVTRAGAT